MVDKYFYNTILSQAFSPCGYYLIAGNSYGEVAVYNLRKCMETDDVPSATDCHKPLHVHTFHTTGGGVLSLVATENFLISGGEGEVNGWEWKDVLQKGEVKPKWSVNLKANRDTMEKPDVNKLVVCNDRLYIAGGDDKVHVVDLDNGKIIAEFVGHQDYIHDIDINESTLSSGSEDGTVRLWDVRSQAECHRIEPHKNTEIERRKLGKWIGTVALTDDWMVCGGGPSLSLWHLASMSPSTIFNLEDTGVHVSLFTDDHIVAGGTAPQIYLLGYNGQIFNKIQSSSTTVFSIVQQTNPLQIMSAGGSGSKLDLCTNSKYRDRTLIFCK